MINLNKNFYDYTTQQRFKIIYSYARMTKERNPGFNVEALRDRNLHKDRLVFGFIQKWYEIMREKYLDERRDMLRKQAERLKSEL